MLRAGKMVARTASLRAELKVASKDQMMVDQMGEMTVG